MGGRGSASNTGYGGIEREAIADYYRSNGYDVDNQGNVTLYHATLKENVESIQKNGFKGTTAPLAAYVAEEVGPRTFFSLTREGVWDGNGSDAYEVMKVKIPAEYTRQAGKDRPTEVYVEGNPKNNGKGVWIPDGPATSTAFDRMIIKRYKKKKGIS